MAQFPAKFSIHKGKNGAFQASVIEPTWTSFFNEKRKSNDFKVTKEGSILIEMAPFLKEENNNKYYNWANGKVSFGIGVADIANILNAGGNKIHLFHKNEITNKNKSLTITPGSGNYAGTYMMALVESEDGQDNKQSIISFTAGEWMLFMNLLKSQVNVLLGWPLESKPEKSESK